MRGRVIDHHLLWREMRSGPFPPFHRTKEIQREHAQTIKMIETQDGIVIRDLHIDKMMRTPYLGIGIVEAPFREDRVV